MTFDGLKDVVGRLLTATSIKVTRPAAAGYDAHGRAAPAAATTFYIEAVYYPAAAKELLHLPEGERDGAPRMVLWTNSGIAVGDLVELDNGSWQVESLAYWREANTHKALARQVIA